MQLDTATARAVLQSAEQANAVAEEATRRVVDLMQEAIEHRERIAELEAALAQIAAFAEVATDANWRDIILHIKRAT